MTDDDRAAGPARYAIAVLATGAAAGLAGAALSLVLHAVELLWFGTSAARGPEAATLAPPLLRSAAVVVTGCITAVGWWLLRRRVQPATTEQAVAGVRMRGPAVLLNALLQVVHVASGASIGREAAPREVGALGGERLSALLGVSARQRQILVAAGAGAGFAAIYDVPLSGALFALEVLLAPAVADAVLPVIGVVASAEVVARAAGAAAGPIYTLRTDTWGPALVALALVLGPLLGVAGSRWSRLVQHLARRARRRNRTVLVLLPIASVLTAAVALAFPQVLGNGQAISLIALGAPLPIGAMLLIALGKAVVTAATLGAGAAGGRLNPSFAIGAASGAAAGGALSLVVAGAPATGGALVGAVAFLTAAQRSPLTAVALAVEFTGGGVHLLIPVLVAVGGAAAAERLLDRRDRRRA